MHRRKGRRPVQTPGARADAATSGHRPGADDPRVGFLSQLDTADRQEPSDALAVKTAHLKEKLAKLATEMERLKTIEKEMLAAIPPPA